MSKALKCTDLNLTYGKGVQKISAFKNISLILNPGQLLLLRGPSGSGKTSLLASLGGLLSPDSGVVEALGTPIWQLSEAKRARFRAQYCGFVFQSVGLFPALSAIEQIAVPMVLMGKSRSEASGLAEACLEMVGLASRAGSKPNEMSGGQNQRVAIARMIAKNPKIILCDEPTSALDGENGQMVGSILQKITKESNVVTICVTHDDRLLPIADRVIDIQDGEIVSDERCLI